jgi:hypothetical protein
MNWTAIAHRREDEGTGPSIRSLTIPLFTAKRGPLGSHSPGSAETLRGRWRRVVHLELVARLAAENTLVSVRMAYPPRRVEALMADAYRNLEDSRRRVQEVKATRDRLGDDLIGTVETPWPTSEAPTEYAVEICTTPPVRHLCVWNPLGSVHPDVQYLRALVRMALS